MAFDPKIQLFGTLRVLTVSFGLAAAFASTALAIVPLPPLRPDPLPRADARTPQQQNAAVKGTVPFPALRPAREEAATASTDDTPESAAEETEPPTLADLPGNGAAEDDEKSDEETATAPAPQPDTSEEAEGRAETDGIPLPPKRPGILRRSAIVSAPDFLTLKAAFKSFNAGKLDDALDAQSELDSRLARTLFEWVYVRDSSTHAGFERIARFARDHPDWPHQQTLRTRMESALYYEKRDAKDILAFFAGSPPLTGTGKIALAHAHLDTDNDQQAAKWARDAWINHSLSRREERDVLANFDKFIEAKHHKERLDKLLYRERITQAQRVAVKLGKDAEALVKMRAAVLRRSKSAAKLIASLPASMKKDPVAKFSQIQLYRSKNQVALAAGLMLTAPKDPAHLGDVNEWWNERHELVRDMIDKGDFETAYRLARDHSLEPGRSFAEAEFLAGWIALRFHKKPEAARDHFMALGRGVSTDVSLSRAEYWTGRAYDALEKTEEAQSHYAKAAAYDTRFYGQLAKARLEQEGMLQLAPQPELTAARTAEFESRDIVRATRLLYELGEDKLARSFQIEMAYQFNDPVDLAMSAQLAFNNEYPSVALQVGKIALGRSQPLHHFAFLTAGVPREAASQTDSEPALIYALVRQESSFNTRAVSSAGARGLMQLMPATAREVARGLKISYDVASLNNDPAYNTRLGATYITFLTDYFDGSYVMAIAGYNAGPGNVRRWLKRLGDPRNPDVDVLDWIERIPLSETRNYVQRVLENLQVYRARLNDGKHALQIEQDLHRGQRKKADN